MNTTTQSNEKEDQIVMGTLSLRDYFAAKALSYVVSLSQNAAGMEWSEVAAKKAYKIADAMIKAREL